MLNLKFPETNVVTCIFSVKTKSTSPQDNMMNELGVIEDDRYLKTMKEYTYRVPEYLQGQLHEGDFVVVYCQTGYQVCQVRKLNVLYSGDANVLAPVVAIVNLCEHFAEHARQEQLAAMKAQLVQERKRLEEQVTWDLIASKSPEFAAMLQAFRDAGGKL